MVAMPNFQESSKPDQRSMPQQAITQHDFDGEQEGDRLLEGIAAAMACLSRMQDYPQSVQDALEVIGIAAKVDRICIFANHRDPEMEGWVASQRWLWVASETDALAQSNLSREHWSYGQDFVRWYAQLSQGEWVDGLVQHFPEAEQVILSRQGVKSILVSSVQVQNTFWGFIALEDCHQERRWSRGEKSLLNGLAQGLGGAIQQHVRETEILQVADDKASGLWQTIEELEREAVKHEEIERILRQSESRFQKLAANSPGVIYQFCLTPDGSMSFPYVSSACWDIFGYHPGEVRRDGKLLTNAVHPDDQEFFLASMHYSAETLRTWEWEGRMLTAAQEIRWIQGSSRPEKQRDGSIIWDGLLLDVSDRKEAEAKIHESYNLLNSVINGTSDHIIVKNTRGQYILVNEALLNTFGIASESILGKDDWSIFPSSEAQKIRLMDQNIMNSSASKTFEETVIVKGKTRTFLTTKTPYYHADESIAGLIAITRDITDRKHAEEALKVSEGQLRKQAEDLQQTLGELRQMQAQLVQSEKMSSLGQLVAGIAHEINNPVNFIYGNIQPAKGYIQDLFRLMLLYQEHYPTPPEEIETELEDVDLNFLMEDLPKLLKSMEVGAERIEKIVSSLRTFSRMDEAAMKAVDLHEGIDSGLLILQNRLKSNDDRPAIEVIKHYSDLPMVECYAGQINQVFMNLLVNAIDAIDEIVTQDFQLNPTFNVELSSEFKSNFQPQITIRTGLTRSNQVTIRIADNGPGVPEEIKSRLFDPFFTTKPVGKGTGMGLSICYQIITKQHGGTLQCISFTGQGAEFVVTIPLKQPG